jgi:M6 family metalloprotease-like protein
MNSYWMETSLGKYGVQLDAFGVYELPQPSWDYFMLDFQSGLNQSLCPSQARVVGSQTAVTTLEVNSTEFLSVGQFLSVPITSPNGTATRQIVAIPDATHVELASATNAGRPIPDNGLVHTCNRNFRTDSLAAWRAGTGNPTINTEYDNIFYVSSGQDESGSWQEFGEQVFPETTDCDGYNISRCGIVPEALGNPNPNLPNWAGSRYIPWSSFASVSTVWPNASGNTSIEGESSGMAVYAHELTHNLSIGDNYNNPFDTLPQRSATAHWDMMSRGSFNGPGGTHTRWQILPTQGSALGSSHNLRNKLFLDFITEDDVLRLNRTALADSGLVVADLTPRAVDPAGGLMGVNIALDGSAPVDKAPTCVNTTAAPNPWCANPVFQNFTLEVVQRIGNDSFDPGNGVLISKTRNTGGTNCGRFSCFVWIVDAHPDDIGLVDFYRPDGTPVMATVGDPRQLQDAAFNAGLAEGTEFEWVDPDNRLHFYIVDLRYDEDGVRHYTVAVRSLDGSGPQTRGVGLAAGTPAGHTAAWASTCTFPLTNTGTSADPAGTHPEDVSAYLDSDVYRLSVEGVSGQGWNAQLYNALATAEFGETVNVPVYVTRVPTSTGVTNVTLRATSESDPSKSVTATCKVRVDDTTPAD